MGGSQGRGRSGEGEERRGGGAARGRSGEGGRATSEGVEAPEVQDRKGVFPTAIPILGKRWEGARRSGSLASAISLNP